MSETKTATVEVLTAEVRVLMVGSRQITLSVFRQLDWVDQDQLDPMGRVNDGEDDRLMIGRCTKTGALVRSRFKYLDPRLSGYQRHKLEQLRRAKAGLNEQSLDELRYLEQQDAQVSHLWPQYHESLKTYESLPLIVLAGLR